MSSNWVNTFDACAAAGIIDYDAAAFLLGKPARYVGHPRMEQLPLKNDFLLPPGTKLNELPKLDVFDASENNSLTHNPTWKKVLFGVVAAAGLIMAGLSLSKLKNFKFPKIPSKLNIFKPVKNFAKKSFNIVKKPFVYIASALKKFKKP